MNIHQVLFFCFLSALQDGNTGLSNAVNVYAGAEGGSGLISCTFTSSGKTKFFCKGECKEEDILIKTDYVTAQSGRYSIRYEDGCSGEKTVTMTITQLTKSDSGRYICGLGGSLVPDSYYDFDIIVTDAEMLDEDARFISTGTEGGSVTQRCFDTVYGSRKFFCKDECTKKEDILVETEENSNQSGRYSIEYSEKYALGLYVTITQLKKSDTGRYRCGYGRPLTPDSSYSFPIFVVVDPNVPHPDYFLPLVMCVSMIVALVAVVLLLLLKMRKNSGWSTKEIPNSRSQELCVLYENCPPVHYKRHPVSMSEDPDYESLDAASMDPDQIYSTLTEKKYT